MKKKDIIERIIKKFSFIPNTGYLQIWLQRISYKFYKENNYDEPICKIVARNNVEIWNSSWLKPSISSLIQPSNIVDRKKLEELLPVIDDNEVNLFEYNY